MDVDPLRLLPVLAVAALAGVVKGSIGFGFPLITVPAVAVLVGTREAVVLISVPVLITNVMLLMQRPVDRAALRRFVPLIVTLAPSTVLGSMLLSSVDTRALAVLIGGLALLFAALSLTTLRLDVPPRVEPGISLVLGVGAGLLHGTTSILGPVFALYLSGLRLEKRTYVWVITLLFTVAALVQVTTYASLRLYSVGLLAVGALITLVALAGQQVGLRIQDRLHQDWFRRLVLLAVAVAGGNLLLRGLGLL